MAALKADLLLCIRGQGFGRALMMLVMKFDVLPYCADSDSSYRSIGVIH